MTASNHPVRILLVEDDPISAAAVQQVLAPLGYTLEVLDHGEVVLDHLASNARYDLVVLDWELPGISGLEVLKAIKSKPQLRALPVVMNTGRHEAEFVREGLLAGAYYYLTKPLEPKSFLAVIEAALGLDRPRVSAQSMAKSLFSALSMASFYCRTVVEARELAQGLAQLCPEPEQVLPGLWELLLNGIEHGNLQISYADKSRLLEDNCWMDEIEARLSDASLGQRRVEVVVHKLPQCLQFTVRDEGAGFDWRNYLDFSPERAFDAHGRGIAMASHISFATLAYQGSGNTVVASVDLDARQEQTL